MEDSSKKMTISGIFKLLIALLLAFLAFDFVRERSLLSNVGISGVGKISRTVSAPIVMNVRRDSDDRCLTFEQGGDLDVLMDEAAAVHLLSAPKGGGSSTRVFLQNCFGKSPGLFDQLKPIKFKGHHVHEPAAVNFFKHSGRETLFIMSYRDETDRLGSAIKHVMGWMCQKGRAKDVVTPETQRVGNRLSCVINETEFVEKIIKERNSEIGGSTLNLHSCNFHDSLVENMPNLVMISISRLDDLFKLISSKYPSCKREIPRLSSAALSKEWDYYLKIKNGTNVEINEWLGHKLKHLELELKMHDRASCQGKTRRMEDQILACPNEAIYNFYDYRTTNEGRFNLNSDITS